MTEEEITKRTVEADEQQKIKQEEEEDEEETSKEPKKQHKNYLALLYTFGVILAVGTAIITGTRGSAVPGINTDLAHNITILMSQLKQSIYRRESYETLFSDLTHIVSNFENNEFKQFFIETAWNSTFTDTLLTLMERTLKSESTAIVQYTLATLSEIYEFGKISVDNSICQKHNNELQRISNIIDHYPDNLDVLQFGFTTLSIAGNISCLSDHFSDVSNNILQKINERSFNYKKNAMNFLTAKYPEINVSAINKENICILVDGFIKQAKHTDGNDARNLCILIEKFNCTELNKETTFRLLRSDSCRRLR